MTARVWPISKVRSSFFGPSVLIFAALLFSSQLALAQFTQQGPKLVGTGAVGSIPASQGWSAAISADGSTAIIGGYNDNSGNGAAWVFTRSNGVWSQQSKLVASDSSNGTGVGWSVAVSADGSTALVGAPDGVSDPGAAYVFIRSSGIWTQQAKLVGTDASAGAQQGWSVALSADGNTALVGGPDDNAVIGAAWVFTRSNGVWSQQGSKLVGTGVVGSQAEQGGSVSLSADGNTAAVGGLADNNHAGAVWMFTRANGLWTQQGNKLVGSGAAGNRPEQGSSVALSGDGSTLIIGGAGDNSQIGAAWVYTQIGGVWTQQGQKLVGTVAVGNSLQGVSVAVSADGNTAVVGGSNDASGSGAVWVFARNGGVWSQEGSKLVGTRGVGASAQGISVALSANGNTAIEGGPADNSGTGAAWVFVQRTVDDCKDGGWLNFIGPPGPFTNQGQCVSYFAKQR
jgi:FG-GAP repeat